MLLTGLKELYEHCSGSINLTTHSAKDDKGAFQTYNAIIFTGAKLIQEFSEDFAKHQAAIAKPRKG